MRSINLRALLLSPRFATSFWTYSRFLDMAGPRVSSPPLGLVTVAALLPADWEIRFVDRNVRAETDGDWDWCDIVLLSAMLAQQRDYHELVAKALRLGKKVAVGGPYPTLYTDHAASSGAHYLVLDEGEATIPPFLDALARGEESGTFRADGTPDVTRSPTPRFDLLDIDAYLSMSIQVSRGCPYTCEFCEIPSVLGRKPRIKEISQVIGELEELYMLDWRGIIFIADDNFAVHKRKIRDLLRHIGRWNHDRGYPFAFFTQTSINVANDRDLLQAMSEAGFYAVFLGIETPDLASLAQIGKTQNLRHPLLDACRAFNDAGMLIYSGMILGFDHEPPGAGERIRKFVEAAAIPQSMIGVLSAVPHTPLWARLEREGRLLASDSAAMLEDGNQEGLPNFVPTRPAEEIACEFARANWDVYEPAAYLGRCYRQCRQIRPPRWFRQNLPVPGRRALRLLPRLLWRQGFQRKGTRWQFWRQLAGILLTRPQLLNLYLGQCALGEHFWHYREVLRERVARRIGYDPLTPVRPTSAAAANDDRAPSGRHLAA
jgi:radical SAM superfamily enzyme YgiQ (UPF0313 family)